MNTAQIIKNMMNIIQAGIYDAHAAKALALIARKDLDGDINPAEIAMSRMRDTYSRMKRMNMVTHPHTQQAHRTKETFLVLM